MRMSNRRESDNLEDRRDGGPITGGKLGIGGILLALVASYFLDIDPSTLLEVVNDIPDQPAIYETAATTPPADDMGRFVSQVLASTEDAWREIFLETGQEYQDPRLVLFEGSVPTACGTGEEAMGPFYCPGDHKVYIDLDFYRELKEQYQAPGEFAQAYIVAHEVGHHVQTLLGITEKVQAAQEQADEAASNEMSVRLELQADCFAGVWGNRADTMQQILEPGEAEQALTAAAAIGDDRLQKQSQGYVVPESFTHGTSKQRMRWFQRGFESGDPDQCDTFKAKRL